MNKQRKYVLRYEDKTMIGAYNCTFNMRIIFCYKAKTLCEGYSIRKGKWIKLLNQNQEIGDLIKKNVEFDYITYIKSKIMGVKEKHMRQLEERSDYQNVLTIMPKQFLKCQYQNMDFLSAWVINQ